MRPVHSAPSAASAALRLLALLLLAVPAIGHAQAFDLGVRKDIATGGSAQSVILADLNGDGNLDMVVTRSSGNVGVWFGNGSGSFGFPLPFATGTAPVQVVSADVNLDGIPDLVTANNGSSDITVLIGGGGGFLSKPAFATGLNPVGIAVVDLNGDAKPDLVTADAGANTVSVFLGDGTGSFSTRTPYPLPGQPSALVVGDFDEDGHPDLAVALSTPNEVVILKGDGLGGFMTPMPFPAGAQPISVATADLNGDGHLDLVVANNGGVTVSVLLGMGNGVFTPQPPVGVPPSPSGVTITDLDGDGHPDLVVGESAGNLVTVLKGNGDGTFGAVATFTTGNQPVSVAVGDVNGDGHPDIVSANRAAFPFTASLLLAPSGFAPESFYATGTNPFSIAIGDITGDGRPDLEVADYGSNDVGLLASLSTGGFSTGAYLPTPGNPIAVSVADLNGDGRKEVLTADLATSKVSVWMNLGGAFSGPTDFTVGTSPLAMAIGDLDKDGKPDIVTANGTTNTMSVLLGKGDGTFTALPDVPVGTGPQSVAVGDLNGDGKLDAVTANGTANTVSVLLGNGNGTFVSKPACPTGTNPQSVAIGDLNGDGKPDLVVADANAPNSPPGYVSVLLGNGNGTFATHVDYSVVGSRPYQVALADVNGDGILDIVTACMYSDAAYVLLGAGDGTFGPPHGYHAGPGPVIGTQFPLAVAVGDLNADGHPDLALADYGSGGASVLLGFTSSHTALGASVNPMLAGSSLTLTATIVVPAVATAIPSGTVSFFDGTTLIGSGPVSGGVATLSVIETVSGLHTIIAQYSGDGVFGSSISAPLSENVVPTPQPLVMQLNDVSGDQGGQLSMSFIRSPDDFPGAATPITHYEVYRRSSSMAAATSTRPSHVLLDGWDLISSFPAQAESLYRITVPTLVDSNASGTHWTVFFVRAATSNPVVYYDSAPESGYAVDNIPPAMPSPFTGAYSAGGTHLHWGANTEPDLGGYRLYRGGDPGFVPSSANRIASPPDTGYVDSGPAGSWYKLSAVDINGNESGDATLGPNGTLAVGLGEDLAFTLMGPHPNPVDGLHWSVAFALPSAEPASLDLIDINGRRLMSRAVGQLGPGRHELAMDAGRRLPSGLYFVRLTQGARSAVTRIAIVE